MLHAQVKPKVVRLRLNLPAGDSHRTAIAMRKRLRDGSTGTFALLLGVLTVSAADLHAQWDGLRYGVVLTNALAVSSPVEALEPMRPGSVVLDASLPLYVRNAWRVEYSFGLIPLAWVRQSIVGISASRVRDTSLGVGVRPVGLQILVGSGRVAIEGSAHGAILRFGRPTPAANAAKTNFVGSLSVGLRVQVRGVDLAGGYCRSHMSNGDRADFNPGIDSAGFYLGIWLS
jgi:hypothetical protein